MPVISVIVPSYGRSDTVMGCISSIISQKTSHPIELILVVDGPDSAHVKNQVLEKFGGSIEISVDTSEVRRGSPRAKNRGATMAKGEIIVFVDDDIIANAGWLDALISAYAPGVSGVGGSELKEYTSGRIRRLWWYLHGGARGRVTSLGQVISNFSTTEGSPISVDCLAGCNMSFKRDAFFEIGGFDENYKGTAYREETDLCVRIRKLGELRFLPSASVRHLEKGVGGNSPESIRNWNYWYHTNNTYFFLKNYSPMGLLRWWGHLISETTLSVMRAFDQRNTSPLMTMRRGVRDGRMLLREYKGCDVVARR